MAKSETEQIKQLDKIIQSLDANVRQLSNDFETFNKKLSNVNASNVNLLKTEYQSLQKRVEDLGKSQERTAKSVDEQIQKVSRSRRVDNKILERQNQLLAAQKRLASTGDLGQRFSSLRNRIGGIDFNSIISTANAKASGNKTFSEESANRFKKVQQDAKDAVDKTTNSIKQQKSSLESMLPTLRRLARAFGVAFSVQGLVQFGKKLVETRGVFEMQFVAMKQIIGDVDAATKIWNQTMQQALQSPFRAMQLVDYTKKLAAYRIETEKLFDTTKRLADVSAGLGVDMGRLILAYGQVKTANYLRASEVRQFTEAGVNIYGELAKYFSEIEGHAVSTAEVVERTSKRMVLFSDVEAIFKRMTDEGGTFFNMQEVQSDTVRGQIMKLHDAYDQMLNTIGQSNQGTIRDLVDTLNKLVRNWQDIAYIIKFNLSVFLPYIAATKIATFGMKKAGDASLWFSNKLIGQRVALSSTNEILKLNSATLGFWHRSLIRATKGVQAFVIGLKSIGRAVLPFAILEGIIFLTEKISEAHRAAARLKEDLEGIKFGNAESLQRNIQGFERLKKAIEDSNDGSQERLRLIEQMNNKYGDYLPHLITEIDTVQQLNDAYDSVIQSMREYSYAKTKEQGEERIRKEMFEVYNDAVNELFGTKSNRQVSYGKTGSFYLEKHEIQDILKQIQDELIKNPELNGQTLVQRLIANYTGIQEAHVDYAHIWAGYVENMRKQVKEMQNLERYAEEAVSPSYRSGEERSRAEELRKKAEAELAAANEAWAKEKDSLTHTIEDSVLKGIQDARKEAAKVDREEGESDAEYNMRLWNARVKADEDANKAIEEQHRITNFAIEEKEKEHQARLLKIRLSNQQISAESYNKQMLAIYPELDDRIKQYNDKIRAMVVEQFGEEWSGNAEAITLFKQMRIGIDDISQGVAQYQKNFAGTVETQIKIVQDLYDWKERGYNIDEDDLNVQREKLAVYVRMARLLGVKTDYNPIGSDLFTDIQRQFNNKYGNKSNSYLPFGNTFFGLEEGDRMLSQIELLDKYTKKWQEYEKTYKTLVESKKNNKDLSEAAAADLDVQIEEAKKNTEASKFLIDLLGYIAKATRGGGQKESASRLISLIKEMRSEYDKLSKSAYGYAKSEEKVRASFGDSWEAILKEAGVPKDFDFSTNAGEIAALERVRDYVKGNAKFAKDAWKDVQKVIDQLKTESEIEVQVRIREDFGRQMEKAFGNYELTLELQGLNIPPDMAKDLFPDLDMTTLGELQDIMDDFYQRQKKTDKDGNTYFDKDDLEQYRKWSDKIDAEILKSRKEKVKQYGKFLEQEYSERAKLEMQHAKDVAFVTANVSDEDKRDNIIKNINEKFEKDLNELNWKSFKESAFYVEMMDDLSSIPMEYMRLMLGKIEEILQHPETLSPRALKEAINARQKIIEAQMDFDQIAVMRDSMKEIREAAKSPEEGGVGGANWRQTKKNLDEEQKAQAEKLANIEEEIEKDKELQGQVKALEDAQLAVANANRALGKSVEADIERNYGNAESVLAGYKDELEGLQKDVSKFTTRQQNIGKQDEEGNLIKITQTEKDINAANEKRIGDLQRIIPLLDAYIKAIEQQADVEGRLGGAVKAQAEGKTSTSIGQDIQGKQNEADKITERLTVIKRWQKAFVNFNNAFAKFNQNAVDMVNRIGALGSAASDTFEALGGETDALTEGWKEFGNTVVSVITEALTMIPSLVAGFIGAGTAINAAMGIIGLIAEAIQLVITLIGALAKLHDAGYEAEIERQQETIDNLKDAYARLEKQIEKTWGSIEYMRTYENSVENIREQIKALEAQMAAEKAKKNTDQDKVREYTKAIQDAYDELEELGQKQIEVFGGLGEEGYRSAAEGFVDAWKSAFLETGDGLQGLQDHFDEFLQDWFVKQATMRIAGGMLENVFKQIDAAVDKYGEGGTSAMLAEIENVRDMAAAIFPDLSLALEELAGMFGVGGEGSLSGLAAGIQGMTEEQANILEAYWNSVRMYTASIDMNVARIAEMLGVGGPNNNPMLTHLQTIANNTAYIQDIYNLLSGTRKNLGNGQGFITYNQ